MFNLSGTELVFLVVIALVVLGPEKLPEAVRKFAKTYGELKKVTTGFQSELRSALDEPMKEMRATADALRDAVKIDVEPDITPTPTPAPGAAVETKPVDQGAPVDRSGPADDAGESASA